MTALGTSRQAIVVEEIQKMYLLLTRGPGNQLFHLLRRYKLDVFTLVLRYPKTSSYF